MSQLRRLFTWVLSHQILSSIVAVSIIAIWLTISFVKSRSDGELTAPIEKGKITESVYGIGTVMANKIWRVNPGVANTISQIWVKEGDAVEKGAKLFSNEASIWRAPFAGTVTSLPYKVGENTFTQVAVLTLVDLADRYLVVSVEQQAALRLRRDQKVKMSFDTLRESSYDGVVVAVYSNETNYLARIDIGALPPAILPGMTADVAISIRERDGVLLVPASAIEGGKYVWRKRGGNLPTRIEITRGIVDKEWAEVVSGDIAAGDRLLIRQGRP